MLTQNMSGVSYVADHSMRSAACAYGRGPMPTYTHLMQPAAAPCMNESAPLTGGLHGPNAHLPLPPPTLLTSSKPPTRREEDKEDMQVRVTIHSVESYQFQESDDEKNGAEDKGRSEDYIFCGVDLKPVLPVALAVSTVIGGLCMLLVQIPMLSRFTFLDQVYLSASFAVLYVVVMGCMGYCAFIDPGQVKKTRNTKVGAMDIEEGMPRRAYKSWQYPRPIRRYDHYCKWLKNVIGLSNHREFVVTVGGLVLIAMLGIIVDLYLAVLIAEKGFFLSAIFVALHLGYSIALLAMAGPILKIHVGLISRNETAQEWKKKEHYVANNTTIGDNIPVEELDDDEYNDIFDRDAFVYDRTRNPFDNGRFTNCWNFWCQPRWPADAKGEF